RRVGCGQRTSGRALVSRDPRIAHLRRRDRSAATDHRARTAARVQRLIMEFHVEIPVRFADCDPAGIVFYPRYFDMFNAVVEDWCAQGWGLGFAEMIMERGWGLPTVRLETVFVAPSRPGGRLSATRTVQRIGGASIEATIKLRGPDGDDRVRGKVVLVLINRARGKAIPLPPEIRERVARYMAA